MNHPSTSRLQSRGQLQSRREPHERHAVHALLLPTLRILVTFLALSIASIASAATHHVPADIPTIEEAFQIAQPGDVILVAPGQYDIDPIDVTTPNISLIGEGSEPDDVILFLNEIQEMFDVQADGFVLENLYLLPFGTVARIRNVEGVRIERCIWEPLATFGTGVNDHGSGTVFRGNRVEAYMPAISLSGIDAVVEDNEFTQCYFGALRISGRATVRGNVFRSNANVSDAGSPGPGGAVGVQGAQNVVIENNRFEENITDGWDGDSGQGEGGAISVIDGSAIIRGNEFIRNQSLRGGAIFARNSEINIRENLFFANIDSVGYPENPQRGRGGALYFEGATGIVENNTLVGNTALVDGAAIYMTGSAVEFRNNLIANNRGNGAGVTADAVPTGWTCNDVWESGATPYAGFPDPTGTAGNISTDPLFCDPAAGNFTLRFGSPCLPEQSICGLIGAFGIGCDVASVPEVAIAGKLLAFPNPAVDHVSFTLGPDVYTSLEIFDVTGRLVRSLPLPEQNGSTQHDADRGSTSSSRPRGGESTGDAASLDWDLRDASDSLVPVGMYWARAATDGGTLSTRVVIISR